MDYASPGEAHGEPRSALGEKSDTDFVIDVLRRCDPLQLIAGGAPPDEYFSEAKDIALRMSGAVGTHEDLADLIWAVFVVWFTPSLVRDRARFEPAVDEIWAYLTERSEGVRRERRERGLA